MSRKTWQEEWEIAKQVLGGEPGTLTRSTVQHEAFRYREGDLLLIFYPHKTTAGNRHLRVRPNRYTERARQLCIALDDGAGNNCTFNFRWKDQAPASGAEAYGF